MNRQITLTAANNNPGGATAAVIARDALVALLAEAAALQIARAANTNAAPNGEETHK